MWDHLPPEALFPQKTKRDIVEDAIFTCDSCPVDSPSMMSGYSRQELQAMGWQWRVDKPSNTNRAKPFVMCAYCVKRYEPAWAKNQIEAEAA